MRGRPRDRTRPARVEVQNPPYGRVRLDAEEREKWSHVLYGHANLYGLFIGAALEDLDETGVLAALVPTSFTSGLYFSKLRETLLRSAPLRSTSLRGRAETASSPTSSKRPA